MLVVLKTRSLRTLLLSSLLFPWVSAYPADAPLSRMLATRALKREPIPPVVSRPVSSRDVFQAVQDYLRQKGAAMRGNLRPGDLRVQSSVPIIKEDAGLEVRKISFDSLRRETVFELWTSHEPQYLPFAVTTRRDPQSWGMSLRPAAILDEADGASRNRSSAISPTASATRSKPRVLAQPGRPATLVMLGPNIRITTTVVPLQPGIKGQCILVRDATTARVMKVEVIGEGLLQAGL